MPPAQNPLSRRQFGALAAAGLAAAAVPPALAGPAAAAAARCYEPTWPSVDRHPPAPEWFQDAKFGIYWHWGAFTTPEYGSEWYGRNMYIPDSSENKHHKATYGDPTVWGYDRFIETRSVDVHVGRLRAKLGAAGRQIETVVGLGYRFVDV